MTEPNGLGAHCTFIKFGQREHMESLHYRGEVYVQPLASHTSVPEEVDLGDIPGSAIRRDTAEGACLYFAGEGLKQVTMNGAAVSPTVTWINVHGPWAECGAYCMCALRKGEDEDLPAPWFRTVSSRIHVKLHPDMMGFGPCFVLLTNPVEFYRLLVDAFEKRGLAISGHGLVTYLPESPAMHFARQFQKRLRFKHQGEWRITTKDPIPRPFTLELGSLEQISRIGYLDRCWKDGDILVL